MNQERMRSTGLIFPIWRQYFDMFDGEAREWHRPVKTAAFFPKIFWEPGEPESTSEKKAAVKP